MLSHRARLLKVHERIFAVFFLTLALAPISVGRASAQIVALVNGSPITALDIEQRTKFERLTARSNPSRQEVINLLIDDRLKVFIAKRYGLEVTESEVDQAIQNMAGRMRLTPDQLGGSLAQQGISVNALRAKIRSDIAWSQIVRGRYNTALRVDDAEISNAMRARGESTTNISGFTYKLYPVTVIVPGGASAAALENSRRVAENLRSRFQNCNEGIRLARALRDIAVREPINRVSSELPKALQELLNSLEVGQLTPPERVAQGYQMFALCERKESSTENTTKRQIREELFSKRFEEYGKRFLDEVRRSAMIEYK